MLQAFFISPIIFKNWQQLSGEIPFNEEIAREID